MKDDSLLYAPRDIAALVEALKRVSVDAAIWGRVEDHQLTVHPHLIEQLSQLVEKEIGSTERNWNLEVAHTLSHLLLRACAELEVTLEERTFFGLLGIEQLFHFEPPRDPRLSVRLRREGGPSHAKNAAPEPQVEARYHGPSGVRVLRCELHEDSALIELELSRKEVAGRLPLYLVTAHRAPSGSPLSRIEITQDDQPVLASTLGAPLGAAKYDRAPIQISWWKEAGERAGSADRFLCADPEDGNHVYAMEIHIKPQALKPQRPVFLHLSLSIAKPLRIYPAAVHATLSDEISRLLLGARGVSAASRNRWALELGESGGFAPDCICIGRVKETQTAGSTDEKTAELDRQTGARELRELMRKLSRQRALTTRVDLADGVSAQLSEHGEFAKFGLSINPASITGHQIFDAQSRQVRTAWRVPVRATTAPLSPAARGKFAAAGLLISERLQPFLPPGAYVVLAYEE